jgi:hypothetical protein
MFKLFNLLAIATALLAPTVPAPPSAPVPDRVELPVPMVFQAPFGVWDRIHADTCEEASLLMVVSYLDGVAELTPEEMDEAMLEMVDYQVEKLGRFESTSAREVAAMAADLFGVELETVEVQSARDLRRQLIMGRPIILPAAGKLLGNPHFQNGGPVYHMLVVKGFDGDEFIVQEPGTRFGEDYRYSAETLIAAVHDYNNYRVETGKKIVLVPTGK